MNLSPFIHGVSLAELERWCRAQKLPVFRAQQIWHWLYGRLAREWPEMTNLPETLRQALARQWSLASAVPLKTAGAGSATRKILVGLRDGNCVEEVLIPAPGRRTVCISSQVGCKFNCAFCASGQAGFRRSLAAAEMVGQVIVAARDFGAVPSHVVFMGIGEPLDNYDAVLTAVRLLNHKDGFNIGARRITISTCGVIPGIRRLAQEGLQVELSVSLHAADEAVRARLMPVNRVYPLAELLDACREYTRRTRRIITFEYTLIDGLNDSAAQAEQLARRLRPVRGRVNLIPLSAVAEYAGRPAPPASVQRFRNVLERAGINVTVRASRGGEVQAACGQLRAAQAKKAE